ncbi:uncharacterized protein LOC144322066 isoform X2 [Canis aureus]
MGSVPVRGLLVNRWNRRCALRSWPEKRDALNLVIPADKKDMGKLVDVYKVLKHLNQDGSLAASFVLQDPFIGNQGGLAAYLGPTKGLPLLPDFLHPVYF